VSGLASLATAVGALPATAPPGAASAGATVLLLRPARPSAPATEALVRLRGELIAAGFSVQVADLPASSDLSAALDRATARARADAVIAIPGVPARQPAELHIVDRITGKTVTRQVPVPEEASRAAEILSIRALELLRASLLEVALAPGDAVTPEAERRPETARPAATARRNERAGLDGNAAGDTSQEPREQPRARAPQDQPSPRPEPRPPSRAPEVDSPRASAASSEPRPPPRPTLRYAVELGGVALGSFDGLPPAVLPVLRGTVRLSRHFQARVALAGLGTRARVQAAGDTADATIAPSFGVLEVAFGFRPGARVQPFLSLGAGAAHLSIEGRAGWPYESRTAALWAAVADAGLGVRIGFGQRFQLAAEAHAQGMYPYPVVRFLDATLAEAGRPTVLGGLSLLTWL